MRLLAIADSFVPRLLIDEELAALRGRAAIRIEDLDESAIPRPETPSELRIREYLGNPRQIAALLTDEDVLAVHAAPVTDAVLDASPNLKVVCVARGGPENVDLPAATERGILVQVVRFEQAYEPDPPTHERYLGFFDRWRRIYAGSLDIVESGATTPLWKAAGA